MQATRLSGALLVVTMLMAGPGIALSAGHPSLEQDMIGIERLHEQDRDATLSDSGSIGQTVGQGRRSISGVASR